MEIGGSDWTFFFFWNFLYYYYYLGERWGVGAVFEVGCDKKFVHNIDVGA